MEKSEITRPNCTLCALAGPFAHHTPLSEAGGRGSCGRTCCQKHPRCISAPKLSNFTTYSSTVRFDRAWGITGAMGRGVARGTDLF